MQKKNQKTREITFYSEKNKETRFVHSTGARRIAAKLERDDTVASYRTNVELLNVDSTIDRLGIRPLYFSTEWTSDFYVTMTDDTRIVYEVSDTKALEQKATVEQLELSRRYWETKEINSWKVIIIKKEETAW